MCNYLKLIKPTNPEINASLYGMLVSTHFEEPVLDEESTFLHYNFFFKKNLKYHWAFRLDFNPAYSFSKKYKLKFFKRTKIFSDQDRYYLFVSMRFFLILLNMAVTAVPNLILNLMFRSLNYLFFNNIKQIMEFFIINSEVQLANTFFALTPSQYWIRHTKKLNSLKKRRKFNAIKKINFLKLESNFFSRKLSIC